MKRILDYIVSGVLMLVILIILPFYGLWVWGGRQCDRYQQWRHR